MPIKQQGECTFLVTVPDSARQAIGSANLKDSEIRAKIDLFLREIVIERLSEMGISEKIKRELDRRVEVAIQSQSRNIESKIGEELQKLCLSRAAAALNEMKITVDVKFGA